MGFGFDFMTTVFPVIFFVMFFVVLTMFVVTAFRGLSQWNRNNQAPVLTVEAEVVAKRTAVGHHATARHESHIHQTYTVYYVTFQVESGDRMELQVDGPEYGMLVEGDRGKLTFQGTRYQEFRRL